MGARGGRAKLHVGEELAQGSGSLSQIRCFWPVIMGACEVQARLQINGAPAQGSGSAWQTRCFGACCSGSMRGPGITSYRGPHRWGACPGLRFSIANAVVLGLFWWEHAGLKHHLLPVKGLLSS